MKLNSSSFKTQYGEYNFSTDLGVQGTINLGVFIPVNAIIKKFLVKVVTAPTGTNATVSFGLASSNQALMVTNGIPAFVINTVIAGVDFDNTPLLITTTSEVTITIATANLTAGRLLFSIAYDECQE